MSALTLGNVYGSGKEFRLPLELVTQSIAILAKRGVGKTYTAAVLCEEIQGAGIPPVIIDPTGAHWGLKSSADGKHAGLPFVVFGGEHADLPLEEGAGEVVARAIVEQRFPAIIDLSLFKKGAMHRFLIGFLETLYRINRQALHVVCDEADVYAPQKPFGEEARTLGAMQDIVRRGRIRGLGCTLITQRPQVLNKDVLTQCEMLIPLRLVHPKDIRAIEEWIAVHGDPSVAEKLIASLPSLPIGTAWFWAPGFGDLFERVVIRRRRTFDSSATPKPGESRVEPKEFATVDLTQLGADIAAAAQRAKENDPTAMRAKIRELEAQLARRPAAAPAERVEVPVYNPEEMERSFAMKLAVTDLLTETKALTARVEELSVQHNELHTAVLKRLREVKPLPEISGRSGPAPRGVPNRADMGQVPRESVERPRTDARAARTATAPAGSLPRAERLILTCLAQFGACSKNRVAAISGYAVNGGGFNNALSALRTKRFINDSEPVDINPDGVAALGRFEPLPTGKALIEFWVRQLSKAEASILNYVTAHYPAACPKEHIAAGTGYEPGGGGFNNALSRLRTLELITGRGEIRASDNLFA